MEYKKKKKKLGNITKKKQTTDIQNNLVITRGRRQREGQDRGRGLRGTTYNV